MLRRINSTHSLILFTLSICLHSINCLCFCDLLVMASGHTIERAAAASLKHTEELWVVRSRAELEIFFLPSHALPDLQESICLWLWMNWFVKWAQCGRSGYKCLGLWKSMEDFQSFETFTFSPVSSWKMWCSSMYGADEEITIMLLTNLYQWGPAGDK